MQFHASATKRRLTLVLAVICAAGTVKAQTTDQIAVTYGMPSADLTGNLANASGWVTLPVYGTQNFSTSTHVHGTIPAELNLMFDPSTHAATLTGLSFDHSPGSLSFDNVSIRIKWSGLLAPSADVSTNGLVGSLGTPNPPGPVAGIASPFSWDAYYHTTQLDDGSAHVVGHFLGTNYPQDVFFNAPPYNNPQPGAAAPGATFGAVSISAGSPYNVSIDSSGYHETIDYTTSARVPVVVSEDFAFDTGFAGTATGHIDVAGGQPGNIVTTLATTFSHTFTYVPGDFNLDGAVDLADLDVWKANAGIGSTWQTGDANHDGVVNLLDLDLWKAAAPSYLGGAAGGGAGAATSVPEPGTLALSVAGLLALLARARCKRDRRTSARLSRQP
jgi:hypothetical protein